MSTIVVRTRPHGALMAVVCMAVMLVSAASVASGSAFSITELGARAAGMGTAFTGVADDGSALYYNPAGIAFQSGRHLQMDNLVVVGLFRFFPSDPPVGQVTPANGFSGIVKPHFIPVASLYATAQLSPRFTLGFGAFTPFGLMANFTNFNDADPALTKFPGRYAGTRARLESFWFQPTIAWKATDNLSLAVGPAFVHTHLLIESSLLNPLDDGLVFGRQAANTIFPGVPTEQAARVISRLLPEGRSRIAGTANGPAFAAGVLWKHPGSKTSVGFAFRSAVTNHLSGRASFAFGNSFPLQQYVGADFLPKAFPGQPITGSFTTPATWSVGVASSRFGKTTVAFDVRLQDFTRFSSVPLNFSVSSGNNPAVALPAERRLVFNFRNSWHVAVGAERAMDSRTTLRLGYLFDRSPVPDFSVGPLFPDSSRNSLTLGMSRNSGNRTLTAFYEAMFFRQRDTNVAANANTFTNGSYQNFAHVFGTSLRLKISSKERFGR